MKSSGNPLFKVEGMSSETVDWLKKVKAKVSFDLEEESISGEDKKFIKPKANAIKTNYTANDLTGLQVSHDFGAFQAGQSDILVLDDSSVLDNLEDRDGSALVSMALKEEERLKRLRDVSRHASGYSGYKEYEEQIEDSVVTLGRAKPAKILQKYDFAATEFTDEPGVEGFRIGSQTKLTVQEPKQPISDFDTVKSTGIEMISTKKKRTTDMDKEKKRANRLAKTIFADEPEMRIEQIQQEELSYSIDDDDLDMQKIIAATRKEFLKTAAPIQIEPVNDFIAGKSFDALVMTESIFANNEPYKNSKGEEKQKETHENFEAMEEDSLEDSKDLEGEEAFSSEPLVRNGVAATLALLNMRGINLKPRGHETTNESRSDIKLEYFDQFGNKLNSKEAYKELSRKFHGKGPGKGKLEKMKRKREDTLKLESASASSATQSAIVTNLRKQQEETGTPYMILSSSRQSEQVSTAPFVNQEVEVRKPKIFGLQLKKK